MTHGFTSPVRCMLVCEGLLWCGTASGVLHLLSIQVSSAGSTCCAQVCVLTDPSCAQTGEIMRSLTGHSGTIHCLVETTCFDSTSADLEKVIWSGGDQGEIISWSTKVRGRRLLCTRRRQRPETVCVSQPEC